ncbi:MAG TPA: NAD(P)-dependent oxidoreductase [Roseiflexaceae bacterium]|nr:NAD(P)-dependent oxidoreductase [Roseiflexaceae bacterium]
MKKIVVTGGSGKAGRATVRELLDHGYAVRNIDIAPPREQISPYQSVDLMDLGQTIEALHGADAVVHLAANPNPSGWTEERIFRHNTTTTYNIFRAATLLGLGRVVWASSETTLGLPFEREQPRYAPIDEEHPLFPESSYALSKVISEEMARQFSRWSGIPFVGLRFSNIMEPDDYKNFPSFWDDPHKRKWNLWSYVDARDVAQSCRRGLEAEIAGAEAFIIAAADTVMNRANRALLTAVFPTVPLREGTGDFDTLLGIGKARRMLGYAPAHSWRDHVE